MVDLTKFEDEIEGLDGLCDIVLTDPTDAQRRRHLGVMLGPDQTPLKVPTGLGKMMDHLVVIAADQADVVRKAGMSPTDFGPAVIQLRQSLFSIAGEIAGLRREQ
jgi:hypothetical protein